MNRVFILFLFSLLITACAVSFIIEPKLNNILAANDESISFIQQEEFIQHIENTYSDVRVFPQITGFIHSSVLSPDGKYVLTGDSDGIVCIWDVNTGKDVKSYYTGQHPIRSVVWSNKGGIIASGSSDGMIRIWKTDLISTNTKEIIEPINNESGVYSIDICPEGKLLVSGSADNTVRIWDISNGKMIDSRRSHLRDVLSVAFSPDGNLIASGSMDASIEIWDFKTGREIRPLTGHLNNVHSVSWNPVNNRQLVSASSDGFVRLWDIETRTSRVIGMGFDRSEIFNAKFCPDGNYIAFTIGGPGTISYVALDYDDSLNISTYDDIEKKLNSKFGIVILDLFTGIPEKILSGHSNMIVSLGWSHDGKNIVSSSYDTTAKLYDVYSGKCLRTFSGKTDNLTGIAISNDGNFVVTGSEGKRVNIWNTRTGVLEQSLEQLAKVHSVAISSDNTLIASGSLAPDIKIWNIKTGEEHELLRGHRGSIFDIAFNPLSNGKQLASASSDGTIRIWDIDTGRTLSILSEHSGPIRTLEYSNNGMFLVSGSLDGIIIIWEYVSSGYYRLKHTLRHGDPVTSVTISPDNRKIISTSSIGTAFIWDINLGRRIDTLSSGTNINIIYSVTFSPDNKYIIAFTGTGLIIRYELDEYGMTKSFEYISEISSAVKNASYSNDGKYIVVGMADGTVKIYKAEDISEIAGFIYFSGEDFELASVSRGASNETLRTITQIDGEWLTITPDGFYRGSPRADRFINVLINKYEHHKMEAFSGFFHRPDVVWTRLTLQNDPDNIPPFTIQNAAAFKPPAINIISPSQGTNVTGNGLVNLSVSITDENLPIVDIRILINGLRLGSEDLSEVTGTSGIIPQTGGLTVRGNQLSVQFSIPVKMVEKGNNRIEIMAYNGISWGYSGYTGSVIVNWEPPPEMEVPLPDLWILAVGVNRYDNANTIKLSEYNSDGELENLLNLEFCGNDASKLVEILEEQEEKRYRKVHSHLIITDGKIEPTAENIRDGLKFLEQARQRDVVLLFLAGHGTSDGGKFYFLAQDAIMEYGKVTREFAITDDDLRITLNMPGRRLIFIDSCQSGGMDINDFMYSLRRTNAYMLSSSEGDKPSYEDRGLRHGFFTYSIIKGLEGMARSTNETNISVLELAEYVKRTVMQLTRWKMFQQRPVQYSWGFSDFDIAR